jgi:hypothetical protein
VEEFLVEFGFTFDENFVEMVYCFERARKMLCESGEINSVFFNLFPEDLVVRSLWWNTGLHE